MMLICPICKKHCKNAGALATHKKKHKSPIKSGSLYRFFKKHSRKPNETCLPASPPFVESPPIPKPSNISPFVTRSTPTLSRASCPLVTPTQSAPNPLTRPWRSTTQSIISKASLKAADTIAAQNLDKRFLWRDQLKPPRTSRRSATKANADPRASCVQHSISEVTWWPALNKLLILFICTYCDNQSNNNMYCTFLSFFRQK